MKNLSDVSEHWTEIHKWICVYLKDDEDAQILANQLHYLGIKHSKQTFAIGLACGMLITAFLISWLR